MKRILKKSFSSSVEKHLPSESVTTKLSERPSLSSPSAAENESIKQNLLSKYSLPQSPVQEQLQQLILEQELIQTRSANDALYLVVEKRWCERKYNGDMKEYLSNLISDVQTAKREYNEIMYQDDETESVMSALKNGAIDLMSKI